MESRANENTTIEFSTDVSIEGQPPPAFVPTIPRLVNHFSLPHSPRYILVALIRHK